MKVLEADKIGSATSPLNLTKTVSVIDSCEAPKVGDVVIVRALSESVTYGNLGTSERAAGEDQQKRLFARRSRQTAGVERFCRRRSRFD